MANVELIGLQTFRLESDAFDAFDSCAGENRAVVTAKDELENEIPGTIAMAGDDSYSVQLIESDCT